MRNKEIKINQGGKTLSGKIANVGYYSLLLMSIFTGTAMADNDANSILPSQLKDVTEIMQKGITVKGTIVDASGEPIIGANVVVKGTTDGTITDLDGNFTIDAAPNATLHVTYIGYIPQDVIVKGSTPLKIVLKENLQNLDEVVVVGFGTQKKVNLTGSVASIDTKALENRPLTSVSAGLAGLLPGVAVTQGSGLPGHDGGTIRVRGVGTLNNSDPMVIVDGVEASMSNLDPNEIESLTVLKDAASAAIYGSKAANGVILITTKRGKEGKTTINYTGNFGWQKATDLPEYMGSAEYATLYNEALRNDGKSPKFTEEDLQKFRDGSSPYTHPNTDWQKLFYVGSGFQTQHNINMNGGTDKVRYMTSLGYQKQDAIIKNTGKDQYNVRVNLDANPTDRIETNVNLSYIKTDLKEATNPYVGGGVDQIFRQVNRISPWIPYKTEDGYYGVIGDGNPIAWMDLGGQMKKVHQYFLGIGSIKYNILSGLDIKGVLSYKSDVRDENEFIKDIQYNPNKYQGPNKMYQNDYFRTTTSADILLTYDKSFGKHNLSALAGFHSELFKYKENKAYRQNFPSNELGDINAGSTAGMQASGYTRELAMLSWFGRVNYDYAGKYLLEANVRYDGSSRFAKGNRWAAFPSFSAGWRISEEDFMEDVRATMQNLKLRASWGKLGNQNAMDEYYPTIPVLGLGYNYPFDGVIASGGATGTAKNPNLKWETSETWGLGFDMTVFNKLNLTFDYYNRTTSDILMEVPTPDTYALGKFIDNVGKVRNTGIELSASYAQQVGEVKLNFNGNFAYNNNKILQLAGQNEIISGNDIKRLDYSLNSLYGYEAIGFYQSQEDIDNYAEYKLTGKPQAGDLKYKDQNNDGVLDGKDRVIMGTKDPKYVFGLNIGAEWKGFDFTAFFQGAAGVKRYMDGTVFGDLAGDDGKPNVIWRDHWTPENPNAAMPRLTANTAGPSMPSLSSSFWLQNANYVRLKNLQIGYTLPAAWLAGSGISRLRIYYSGQNLFTATKFINGWDPEAPSGRGSHYPQVMVNSFGINLTF